MVSVLQQNMLDVVQLVGNSSPGQPINERFGTEQRSDMALQGLHVVFEASFVQRMKYRGGINDHFVWWCDGTTHPVIWLLLHNFG